MDFPQAEKYHKPIISSFALESIGYTVGQSNFTPGSLAWPTANLAIFVPFSVAAEYLVKRVWWNNGATAAGNVDCGVYTADPTTPCRLFSAGSTAQGTVSATQSVSLGTPYLLTAGTYYMALAFSSTSGTVIRSPQGLPTVQAAGVAIQTSAFPLPATATLATSTTGTLPIFGISSGTVI